MRNPACGCILSPQYVTVGRVLSHSLSPLLFYSPDISLNYPQKKEMISREVNGLHLVDG